MNTTNNFYGNISNSQIQQNTQNSAQTLSISETYEKSAELSQWLSTEFNNHIKEINLDTERLNIIEDTLKGLNSELNKENPSNKFVKEGLSTLRNLLEGVSGSIIASGLIYQLGLFI